MNTSVIFSQPDARQFFVRLTADERAALITLASRERRDPRDQAALIIRHELQRLGFINATLPTREEVSADATP